MFHLQQGTQGVFARNEIQSVTEIRTVFIFYYRPQRNCEGYIFTPVCHSVHGGGGGSASVHAGIPPPGAGPQPPWEQTPPPPGSRHPSSRRLLLRTVRILLECILVRE